MWHEARKQEKLIRGMIVDYRRRAERRKDFYEKIKAEPTQFLQLHGRPCKIHLDPAIAAAGEGPAIMMPWQGDTSNMIDRFDVRAHLDYIPEVKNPFVAPEDLSQEERQCNYESYRILAQNSFLGISEEKFLQQLAIEEQFGVTIEEKEMQKEKLNEKKGTGAAIGYNYNDPGAQPSCSNPIGPETKKTEHEDSDDDSDLEIIDVDLSIDVNKMEASQAHELNSVGPLFGMAGCDLFSFLTGDADDAEHQKQLLREEKEKAMFSGRKSRRERRAHRDKKLQHRVVSPPSYAAPRSAAPRSPSRSASRSPEPEPAPAIQFITSFGQDDDDLKPMPPIKPLYADKLKQNLKPEILYSDVARRPPKSPQYQDYPRPLMGPHRPPSYSRSRSSRSASRSRSRSASRSRSRSRPRSRSRSYSPRRRSRSRSASRPHQYRRRSRSPDYNRRNRSRSMSYESNKGQEQSKAVPRYYGRRKEDKSSSELSLDSDSSDTPDDGKRTSAVKSNSNQNQLRLSGSSSKGSARQTNSLKEKLKKKMQAQLSRQLRLDKRLEAARSQREARRQARRDEEMRALALKLRRKQREMRHQQNKRSSEEDSDASHSGSSKSRDSPPQEKKDDGEERDSSKSPSPTPKRIPVWETNRDAPRIPQDYRYEEAEPSFPEPSRRRHDNDGYYKEEERPPAPYPPPNRYDKYPPNRDYQNRYENRDYQYTEQPTRWDQNFARRRPYGHRGGYRGQGRSAEQDYEPPDWQNRPPPPPPDADYGTSSNYKKEWQTRPPPDLPPHNREGSYKNKDWQKRPPPGTEEYNKSKVKLVDY